METKFRTLTWKVQKADKTLGEILQTGDRLVFVGEGDTCRCICLDKKSQRRHVWENAYVCDCAEPIVNMKDLGIRVQAITGAMLSVEHEPYIIDAALVELPNYIGLFGELHSVHDAPAESLAKRLAANVGDGSDGAKLSLGAEGPFGHASGQWHAEN